jgi:predicted Zn-dependent protease
MNNMGLTPIESQIKSQQRQSIKLVWLTLPLGLILWFVPQVLATTVTKDVTKETTEETKSAAIEQPQAIDQNASLKPELSSNQDKEAIAPTTDSSSPADAAKASPSAAVEARLEPENAFVPVELPSPDRPELDAASNANPQSAENTIEAAAGKKGRASDLLDDDATLISRPQPIPVEQTDNIPIATSTDPDSIQLDLSEFSGILEAKLSTRQQRMIEADRLYRSGQIELAEQLYRQVKSGEESKLAARTIEGHEEATHLDADLDLELDTENSIEPSEANRRVPAIYEIELASAAAQVYWREYQAGMAKNLETRVLVPLQLLTTDHPEFIPGHITYAEVLEAYDRPADALKVLEIATTIYPDEPKLMLARIKKLGEAGHWLDSSIAAREFALLNPDHEDAAEFLKVADQNLERFKDDIRTQLREKSITSAIVGAAGYALTGSLIGPLNSVQSLALIAQGEVVVGEKAAASAQRQLKLIEDPLVVEYVQEVGQKLAAVSGRDEFNYEFYVIAEEEINAFAMPGGKIFINAGAIAKTNSEAELAGLLAHEISHAVLSHGFQLVTQSALNTNLFQFLPFGGTAANLFTLDYSREMERQADTLGTRILASSDYAADGLHNLMITMGKEQKQRPPAWMSTHPETDDRVAYIDSYINEQGYNRYAYEGVERHLQVQQRVLELMPDMVEQEPAETVYKLPNRLSNITNP